MRWGLAFVLVMLVAGCDHAQKPHTFRTGWLPHGYTQRVHWVDGERPLELHDYAQKFVRSPDGRSAAFGDVDYGRLRFVDLVGRRFFWIPRVGRGLGECSVTPLLWATASRLTVDVWCGDVHRTSDSGLVVLDPSRRRIVGRPWDGMTLATRHAGSEIVLLLMPRERIGTARLGLLRADGTLALVRLPVRAGMARGRSVQRLPGFVVGTGHAYVFAEEDGIADVELATLRVTLHRLRLLSRGERVATKPVLHVGTTNPARIFEREAIWVGRGKVRVTGSDTWTHGGFDRHLRYRPHVVDVSTWRFS